MARNSEKAQSMLFRFRAQQAADLGILDLGRTTRPKGITSVTSVQSCERWRGQVLKEISRKISKIQDPALSDFQLRDLNDEINKLMREKHVWEIQIRQLGGPNYARGGTVRTDDGRVIEGAGRGYRYFGRARELPGVKELFEASTRPQEDAKKVTPREPLANLDASYFGFNSEEEEQNLQRYELIQEKEAVDSLIAAESGGEPESDWVSLPGDSGNGVPWHVPSLDQVQQNILERRRQRLLDKL